MPVNIEIFGERRRRSVFEHVSRPGIFTACRHVVGNHVEQKTHCAVLQIATQAVELRSGSQFRIQPRRVRHVVPVQAASSGRKDRRGIEVADAELVEVSDQPSGIFKTKVSVELQSVGGDRHK